MTANKSKKIIENSKSINKKLHCWIINLKIQYVFLAALILNILGAYANKITPFPLYYYFTIIFTCIAIIVVLVVCFFAKKMEAVMIEVGGEPRFRVAKYFYFNILNAKLYYLIPFSMIILYAGTGISMIKNFQLNASMVYALFVFTITVYFSILAYIQYISLAIFIYKVRCSNEKYLDYIEQSPANTKVIYMMSSLIKIYRNAFFSIGSLYIIAFGLFTLSGEFGVIINLSNVFLLIGWLVILVAIVIVFPLVSFLEKGWMVAIIRELKVEYTLKIKKTYAKNDSDKLQASDLIISIWQTPEYPFRESLSILYASLSAMVNLLTVMYYAKELFFFSLF